MKKRKLLKELFGRKSEVVQLLFASVLLALGISLVANYFTEKLKSTPEIILYLAIGLIVVVLIFFIFLLLRNNNQIHKIKSVIVINKSQKFLSRIPRFELSEKMYHALQASFIENEALKKYWNDGFESNKNSTKEKPPKIENPIDETSKKEKISFMAIKKIEIKDEDEILRIDKSKEIIIELIEYLILEELSTHLSTYFHEYRREDTFLKEYNRKDVPHNLLENRIINLLTTPFENRGIFVKAGMADNLNEGDGEVVMIMGSDGSKFTKFDLILPTGSKINRPKLGIIEIENKRIKISIDIKYRGYGSTLPKGMAANYMGIIDDELDIHDLKIELKYSVKPLSVFSNSKWSYYNWIDSFANRLIKFASIEKFKNDISWQSNLTQIIVESQRRKIINKMRKKRNEEQNELKNEEKSD